MLVIKHFNASRQEEEHISGVSLTDRMAETVFLTSIILIRGMYILYTHKKRLGYLQYKARETMVAPSCVVFSSN